MKKSFFFQIILAVTLGTLFSNCESNKQKDGFTIKGKANNRDNSYIYLNHNNILDSTIINNGSFEFIGKVKNPTEAYIYIDKNKDTPWKLGALFILENSPIKLQLKYSTRKKEDKILEDFILKNVEGSHHQNVLDNFTAKIETNFYATSIDSIKRKNLYSILDSLITNYPEFEISGNKLAEHVASSSQYLTLKQVEILYSKIDTFYQKKRDLDRIEDFIKKGRSVIIGGKISNFSLPDMNNKIVDLYNVEGKLVLIEFWASWCAPCRVQNIELRKLYNKFHRKGFEIISVTVDKNEKLWKKAIEKDGVNWINLKDSGSQTLYQYNISNIPYNILINDKGVVIAKNIEPFHANNTNTNSLQDILNKL